MTVTINLPPDKEAALIAAAQAQGVSAELWLQLLVEERLQNWENWVLGNEKEPPPHRPLSARIRSLWADMPNDVRAEYPEGGAQQIDHHVYGLPKR